MIILTLCSLKCNSLLRKIGEIQSFPHREIAVVMFYLVCIILCNNETKFKVHRVFISGRELASRQQRGRL